MNWSCKPIQTACATGFPGRLGFRVSSHAPAPAAGFLFPCPPLFIFDCASGLCDLDPQDLVFCRERSGPLFSWSRGYDPMDDGFPPRALFGVIGWMVGYSLHLSMIGCMKRLALAHTAHTMQNVWLIRCKMSLTARLDIYILCKMTMQNVSHIQAQRNRVLCSLA
jgi:hypothetical protein